MTAFPLVSLLAQTSRPAAAANRLWHTIGLALLFVVAGVTLIVLAMWLKRQFFGGPTPTVPGEFGGFTLGDLRRLRAEGQMTEAEFQRAKAMLVAPARRDVIAAAGDEREADVRTKDVDLIRDAE